MELVDLLKRQEGKSLEFKRDLSSPDGVLRTMVAFANTAGGVVLIGVEDRTRRVRGVEDPLETEERLANLIADNIHPRLVPEIEILPWRETSVIGVQVHLSGTSPHHFKRLGPDKGVFVRVGSTNRLADRSLIEELRRHARGVVFDEQPLPELYSEAIDFRAASELFAPVRRLRREDLRTLRIVTRHQGREVPSVGGLLLFGKDRHAYFPDAWIHAGRFEGTDRRRILDTAELRSLPVMALEEAIRFVQKHMTREAVIGAVRRLDRWTLPPAALREVVINAVVHADYSQTGAPIRVSLFDDRLEVDNPGLLPFGLTVEDLRRGTSKLRNRVIGRVFHELGLIEQWGSGIQRMTAACREAGLEEPVLEEIGTHFRVTIYTARRRRPATDARDQAILALLAKKGGLATHQVAKELGISERATRTRLISLIDRGLVVEVGSGPQDPRRRYYLAER